jgi:hypothetical protein
MKPSRKHLSAQGLLGIVHEQFQKIKQPRTLAPRATPITLIDCLMSGLAVFSLKFPSLLKFDEGREEIQIKHNLQTLYSVKQAPSDTYMRERLDEVEPREIRKAFKALFSCVQRGKGLEAFEYLEGRYLLPGDGTGFFSSRTVHCENCCMKHQKKCRIQIGEAPYENNMYVLTKPAQQPWVLHYIGHDTVSIIDIHDVSGLRAILGDKEKKALSKEDKAGAVEAITAYYRREHVEGVTYYHQMFCAAIVHPDIKMVLPLAPEPIMKTDGATKNDCGTPRGVYQLEVKVLAGKH